MNGTRVLFAAPSAYVLSGLAVWLDYLLPGLKRGGWDPLLGLVCGRMHDCDAYLAAHPFPGTALVRNRSGSLEGRIRAFERVIRETDPDLIVSVNIPDSMVAAERVRRKDGRYCRAAMAIHGLGADILGDAARFSGILDGVASTNRLGAELAVAYAGVAADRVHYAPGGTNVPAKVSELGPLGSPMRLLYVGRLEQPQKRVHDTVEIMAALARRGHECELTLVGAGPEETALRRRAEGLGVGKRLRIEPFTPQADIERLFYPHADALLIPSRWETGPLVAWEAMAHGLPVISSRYLGSGLENALKDGETALLFPVGDIEKAADCVSALYDDALRRRIVSEGRALVERRYSFEASVNAWEHVFSSILAAPPLPPVTLPAHRPPKGRLDKWLGVRLAEDARELCGVRFAHSDPGGEWPHSYGAHRPDQEFWECARRLDARPDLSPTDGDPPY